MPPLFNSKPTFEILTELAKRWGVLDKWSKGMTQQEWVDQLVEDSRATVPEIPATLEELRTQGVVRQRNPAGHFVALADFRKDPEANPLMTESGKIEIFSKKLYDMAKQWTWEFAEPGLSLIHI